METIVRISSTPDLVANEFAGYLLEKSLREDRLTIALSGGSTPTLLFDILAMKYKERIPWDKVHFFWGDERCVPPDHEESNYKMTYDHLLKHISIPEENIHRVRGEDDPEKERIRYGNEIRQLLGDHPVFDIVMLGMGTDGHTASIFPHQMELLDSKEICATATHPESGQIRVTLTGNVINSAKRIFFLVTGASKSEKAAEIINQDPKAKEYPAAHIRSKEGKLYWYLDEAAAQLI
jgi:6-phosphogluconolactonase